MSRLAPLLTALLFLNVAHAAPNVNKCTDGREITYTDKPCKKLGLKEAGPLKDTVTITPAPPPIDESLFKPAPEKEETLLPASAVEDTSVYQCTTYYGVVSFSSSPCTGLSFVPQLGAYVPPVQQTVPLSQACGKMNANAEIKARSKLSCP